MRKKIVVLGGSFGGLTAALEIKRLLKDRADVTLISNDRDFVFLPSLPWLIMGSRRARDITLKVEDILKPRAITFIHATVTGVDPDSLTVYTDQDNYHYDYLVISTGPHLSCDEIPGLGPEGGHTHCTFSLKHAEKSRVAWARLLSEPGPVVVGSTQMASCFGPYYELAFEMDYELRKRKMRHKVPLVYLTSEPYVGHMGVGGLGKSRRFLEDEFAERDIKAVTNQSVDEIIPDEIRLASGITLPFKLAMLAPPFKGVAGVAGLGNPRGFIPADDHYRHPEHQNIYTIGVAMALAPAEPTPVPTGVPKTGFMTVKMAKAAAVNIVADIDNQPPVASKSLDIICLMDMGKTAALMVADPVLPPRQKSHLKEARWAKWAKIRFEKYFLWKMRHGYSRLP
ncbi:pyridine nucleotide-disulfide oxidoreductase [Desulfolithobacter dissulfuricans]|uniref:Pyridine nucleotide-disulfide oxidoreductase n=1 Tax=Desulfolithobacter dissulfuricans TaxID=2795293 RepID=A0A915XHL1_9BACT|nr:FAD-dependent oxidoreductase [Desulfolithobacter dissulfuricans]BCO08170.1 pyridine nucleotide-disulfide oxidoreductase [Desulfolithobacter dissulfuricans]